jgi:transglutaminase-like putative cysteine protease
MTIRAGLHHVTRYRYDRPVGLGPHVVRLRPAPHCRTKVPSYSIKVTPEQHFINWQQDAHGNWIARYVFPEKATEFSVTVDFLADLEVINPFDFFVEPYAETFPFSYDAELRDDLAPYLALEPAGPQLAAYLESIPRTPRNTVDFLVELNQRLQKEIRYLIRLEPGVQTAEETLTSTSGSCRDTAWLLVQVLRGLGLAARFVSGYLIQLKPDLTPLDGPAGVTQDFTDLHAWTEVYLPGAGWIGLDPTSGLLCGEGHLPVAATPHYRTAAPINGAVEPAKVDFSFEMSVVRVDEKPRVTLPFSDEAWAALDALGDKVDADLVAQDVRLTMGGEPTFVSVDDYQSAEWNTAALGPTKRIRADELIRRLRTRFAPGGLLHYGEGKWYPGEELPRWAFSLLWRTDGVPVWRNEALAAGEKAGPASAEGDAHRLATGVAAHLGLAPAFVQPVFEDPIDRMQKDGEIPENVDPEDPQIDDPVERARLARLFERRLGAPAGFVLPVQRWTAQAAPGWLSEVWQTRRKRLYLAPGDSPIGLRLPLHALPYVAAASYPFVLPADPMLPREPLPLRRERPAVFAQQELVTASLVPDGNVVMLAPPAVASNGPVRTALSVE